MSKHVVLALIAAGCGVVAQDDADEGTAAPAPLERPPRLVPPASYVLAPDGATQLTLEQAGILKPDGRRWALVLGKALFWDQQAGSDGNACASCHAMAGADLRIRNQLSPGIDDEAFAPDGDTAFGNALGRMPSGAVARPNYRLTPADFPLLKLTDKRDRNSAIASITNDAISSQGSFASTFVRVRIGGHDRCEPADSPFQVDGANVRQVEPRNTPTVINSAFFHANFWDGRANNTFNGVGTFGMRDIHGDRDKRLIVLDHGQARLGYVQVKNASLASQAVAPPTSALEMSCSGRTFPDIGRKLLRARPLAEQRVHPQDSVLGPYARASGKGLKTQYDYEWLIKNAFDEKYWSAGGKWRIEKGTLVADPKGHSQIEMNFSMFWGLAIMIFEQTLVSDQSRFDDWFESCKPAVANPGDPTAVPIANPVVTCTSGAPDPTAHGFTAQEALGFGLFNNGGVPIRNAGSPACSGCHPVTNPNASPLVFPVFSEAAFQAGQTFVPVERSRVDDPGFPQPFEIQGGSHDRGFFNLGLRPARQDLGNGRPDPYGNPLSIARTFLLEQAGIDVPDPSGIANRCTTPTLVEPGGTPPYPGCENLDKPPPRLDLAGERLLVDGTFKTPSIRNVGLTPPYFHYGGYSNLRSVVEVYARGGSKRNKHPEVPDATGDWSGTGARGNEGAPAGPHFGTNVDFFIRDIKSTDEQIDALVAFMLTVTDPRVPCDMAPFDHPEITLTNGHEADHCDGDEAEDRTFVLPAVGAGGYSGQKAKYCIPNAGDLFAPGMGARRGEYK
ncbi:MAG: hypothetical protein KF773_02365 [Deltaproteobacteria bacterium]|nr:hypothetical protein [Deltaproteobacteria bacterium]